LSIPVVYIAGPYRAPSANAILRNIMAAREVATLVWSVGGAALCPHLNTAFMDGVARDADFLAGDLELLRRCDAVFVLPNWHSSEGTKGEVSEAKRRELPIITDCVELRRWIASRLRGEA